MVGRQPWRPVYPLSLPGRVLVLAGPERSVRPSIPGTVPRCRRPGPSSLTSVHGISTGCAPSCSSDLHRTVSDRNGTRMRPTEQDAVARRRRRIARRVFIAVRIRARTGASGVRAGAAVHAQASTASRRPWGPRRPPTEMDGIDCAPIRSHGRLARTGGKPARRCGNEHGRYGRLRWWHPRCRPCGVVFPTLPMSFNRSTSNRSTCNRSTSIGCAARSRRLAGVGMPKARPAAPHAGMSVPGGRGGIAGASLADGTGLPAERREGATSGRHSRLAQRPNR